MSAVKDKNGNEFQYYYYDLVSQEESSIIVLTITPSSGKEFKCTDSGLVTLFSRETGSGDPFVDLSDGIDLTSYPEGVDVQFDVFARAKTLAEGNSSGVVFIGVFDPVESAGWEEGS